MIQIPFNKPYMTGSEFSNIQRAQELGQLSGDGEYTKLCSKWLESKLTSPKALLTHSCTAALEMAAMLINIQPGDEIIMPSFTFVSTANAFVLRGAVPVFVDIKPDDNNIDTSLIEEAITERTRAIVVVHYAGVACNMNQVMELADSLSLYVVEDAAQALLSTYKGEPLGSIGHLSCFSFHETKNVICGEGGALVINSPELIRRAEIIREKGTNRSQFIRGQVDKYTWVDLGSSYLPGELISAFLYAQLIESENITKRRRAIWNYYDEFLATLKVSSSIKRPVVGSDCYHNAHMYYIKLDTIDRRSNIIQYMSSVGVQCVFHYQPLHSSPFGKKVGRASGSMKNTDETSDTLLRLPLWLGVESHQDLILDNLKNSLVSAFKS